MVWIDQRMKRGRGRDFAFALVKHNIATRCHYLPRARLGVCIFVVRGLEHLSRPADARQQPSHDSVVRLAAAALKLVLLDGPFGESRGLICRLSLVIRKRHPLANDFPTRLVVFHVCGSLGCNFSTLLGRRKSSSDLKLKTAKPLGLDVPPTLIARDVARETTARPTN